MSGIKNIKKKLKGFQVRPPNAEVIKKVLLHIPYVVVFYVVNKCTWLYQYCRGSTVVDRLMVLLSYSWTFPPVIAVLIPENKAAASRPLIASGTQQPCWLCLFIIVIPIFVKGFL